MFVIYILFYSGNLSLKWINLIDSSSDINGLCNIDKISLFDKTFSNSTGPNFTNVLLITILLSPAMPTLPLLTSCLFIFLDSLEFS